MGDATFSRNELISSVLSAPLLNFIVGDKNISNLDLMGGEVQCLGYPGLLFRPPPSLL